MYVTKNATTEAYNDKIQNILNITNKNATEVTNVNNKIIPGFFWNFSQVEMNKNVTNSISYSYDVQAINIFNVLFCLWMFFALLNFARYKHKTAKKSKQKMTLVIYSVFCSIFPSIRIFLTYSILFVEWLSTAPNDRLCEGLSDSANVF